MKGTILQPGYLPWLGFFNQMFHSDIFVFFDDVQFDRRGWRHRNRIKGPQGTVWLTIPIQKKGKYNQLLNETLIDNQHPWRKKHIRSIEHFYKQSKYFKIYFQKLSDILYEDYSKLIDLDMKLIFTLMEWLNLKTKTIFSSELKIKSKDKTGRLVEICRKVGINEYITGPLCKNYIDYKQFQDANIQVFFHEYHHPIYTQRFPPFIPYLSIIDLLFNEGSQSSSIYIDSNAFQLYKG